MRTFHDFLTRLLTLALAILGPGTNESLHADEPVNADILLAGGTLHLGDGKPAQEGDLAIADGKIVAVGAFEHGQVKRRVECEGLIVCPGFIDLHSHSDVPATRKETRLVANFLTQGCTTVVTGNCGSGPIQVGDYYAKLDDYGVGVNIAHLLPQGSLRKEVLQSERREATPSELDRMKALAGKAMEDGAWGMSTGLIYVPSSYANTQELIEIATVISRHGGIYASHIRNEGTGLLDAVNEAVAIGRGAELPVHISHFKSSGKDSWGLVRVAVDIIEKHQEAGLRITADQYPYVASSTSLAATFIPAWARAGGTEKMLERLTSGPETTRVHEAIRRKLELTDQGQRIQIARYKPDSTWAGQRLKEIATHQRVEPFELVLEILKQDSGTKIVNYGINEQDVRYVMQRPWVATASDGSARIPSEEVPHPRNFGTFPRKIGHYSVREGVIPLPQAIRSASGLPADILGMNHRGYLRVGYAADIAVWRKGKLIDRATFDAPDRYSEGIRYLLVNGTPAIWDGDVTGALAGQALRHSSSVGDVEIESVNGVVQKYFPEGSAGGLAVLVTKDGQVIHSRGYGTVQENESMTSTTKLSLASVTKQFAAMCAAMLIEQGKLDPKQKVAHYLPDLKLPIQGRELLVQDLVWHTCGLPNFINKPEKEAIAKFKQQHGLKHLNNKTHAEWLGTMQPRRAPGQKYEYTNSGYVLLARIIEVVSGQPFHDFQKQRILDVLGMNDTVDSTRFNGSGNMKTSLRDYAKWDRALWENDRRLLSAEGYPMLFRQGVLDNGEPVDYGFGWKLNYDNGQLIAAEHGGWGSGTTAARNLIKRFNEHQITVAIFAQEHPAFGRKTESGRSIREVMVDEIYQIVREAK